MKKNCFGVYYKWVTIQNQTVIKAVLELSHYANKKNRHGTGVDTSDLAAKNNFIALKAEFDKLNIIKLFHIPTSLNNLKTKVDNLDVDKLKTVPVDLKN